MDLPASSSSSPILILKWYWIKKDEKSYFHPQKKYYLFLQSPTNICMPIHSEHPYLKLYYWVWYDNIIDILCIIFYIILAFNASECFFIWLRIWTLQYGVSVKREWPDLACYGSLNFKIQIQKKWPEELRRYAPTKMSQRYPKDIPKIS